MREKLYLITFGIKNSAQNTKFYSEIDNILEVMHQDIKPVRIDGTNKFIGQCRFVVSKRHDAASITRILHANIRKMYGTSGLEHFFITRIPKDYKVGDPDDTRRNKIVDILKKYAID